MMEANKIKKSKKHSAKVNLPLKRVEKPSANSKSNEEQKDKDIFIDIEPSSSTVLSVQPPTPDKNIEKPTEPEDHPFEDEVAPASANSVLSSETQNTTDILSDLTSDIVTRLSTSSGSEVFLVGTAHFSPKSAEDVKRVINAVSPSIVVLELCRERAFMLSLNEETLLEQNKNLSFDKIRGAIREKGMAQGLVYIIFLKMSASLTEKLGMAPGSEFRVGAAEANKIPGCRVILGDRSLKTTVARAVASLSTWQTIKLLFEICRHAEINQEDVEKCKDKDMLSQLLAELGGQYPGLLRVLVEERNTYLAHSIYQCAQSNITSFGPQRVVAIMGIGHVKGIVEHWGKTTDEDIMLLNEIPQPSRTKRFVSKTIKYSSMALLLYVGYRLITPSNIQSAIAQKFTRSSV